MNDHVTWTEEERMFASLLQRQVVEAPLTPHCFEPDDFLQLVQIGKGFTKSAEMFAHMSDCLYCCREYSEIQRALELAAELRTESPTMPSVVPQSVDLTSTPHDPFKKPVSVVGFLRSIFSPRSYAGYALAVILFAVVFYLGTVRPQSELSRLRIENQHQSIQILEKQNENQHLKQQNQQVLLKAGQTRKVLANRSAVQEKTLESFKRRTLSSEQSLSALVIAYKLNAHRSLAALAQVALPVHRGVDVRKFPSQPLTPINQVVEQDRPLFRWKPLHKKIKYQIIVSTPEAGEIARSTALDGSSGYVKGALTRGRDYLWCVYSVENEQKPLTPTVAFRVLDSQSIEMLQAEKRKKQPSHRVLGALYMQALLLTDAEREFQLVLARESDDLYAQQILKVIRELRSSSVPNAYLLSPRTTKPAQ